MEVAVRHVLFAVVLLLAACSPARGPSVAPRTPAAVPSLAEKVVQAQLEAFNRRDIDGFLATYAPDVKMYSRTPFDEHWRSER
jgi:hypothetical protein